MPAKPDKDAFGNEDTMPGAWADHARRQELLKQIPSRCRRASLETLERVCKLLGEEPEDERAPAPEIALDPEQLTLSARTSPETPTALRKRDRS